MEGFTALPITQVKVASSGETVVEVKYDRNSYLLTWNTDGGSYIEPQMLNTALRCRLQLTPRRWAIRSLGGICPERCLPPPRR